MSSVEGEQDAAVIVQRRVAVAPGTKPVTVVVAELGVVMVAIPEVKVHNPLPVMAVLPARLVLVKLHSIWSMLASDVVGAGSEVSVTSSKESAQLPLLIVHLNTDEAPTVKPVNPEVGEEGVLMSAEPELTVHTPLPTTAALPARVLVVTLHRF